MPSQNGKGEQPMQPAAVSGMPDIVIIGANHRTAPVALRERLAFSDPEINTALEALKKTSAIHEAMIFSTCNRVEVLLATGNPSAAVEAVTSFICKEKSVSPSEIEGCTYTYSGEEAVRHVFRVAASLDSMMVGEPQILGQVKAAYKAAVMKKSTGVILNRLMHKAFSVAKLVRTETGIGGHAVSISYAAVELAKKIFDTLDDKTILLVGAGEMAELAVEHLMQNRCCGEIYVANRTLSAGMKLAGRFKGKAIRLEEIDEKLETADIIISSTGAPGFVITYDQVKPVMRKRKQRPLFFIDIAVPRDIDPAINKIPNIYVYDIDDLQGVINENIETRRQESIRAERIIDEAVLNFKNWLENLDVVPTIVALREKLQKIARSELSKTLASLKHLNDQDHLALERMLEAFINKILHDPTVYLKNPGVHRNRSAALHLARLLFKLDE